MLWRQRFKLGHITVWFSYRFNLYTFKDKLVKKKSHNFLLKKTILFI